MLLLLADPDLFDRAAHPLHPPLCVRVLYDGVVATDGEHLDQLLIARIKLVYVPPLGEAAGPAVVGSTHLYPHRVQQLEHLAMHVRLPPLHVILVSGWILLYIHCTRSFVDRAIVKPSISLLSPLPCSHASPYQPSQISSTTCDEVDMKGLVMDRARCSDIKRVLAAGRAKEPDHDREIREHTSFNNLSFHIPSYTFYSLYAMHL
ncbi:uncharacterized protein LOC124678686 isoform X2 [Lolium rigidum]|uniref:uncharacterized protein LOC124678686 isoform X2 n=1 Tax=Lolium rigidum TaxID=89674 RepID=UPI001F5C1B8E|nr:uncharacterized protein LOC124678686 isoform X2 [Lolium rigidum]